MKLKIVIILYNCIIFSELKSESKKKERRKDDKLKGENTSTTDEELMDSQRK